MKSPDRNPRWARSPWTTNCCRPRSPPWRPKALWPEGGRDDEPDGLAFHVSLLWPGAGLARGVFRAPACIAFSSERHRLRSPVAAVRQALVGMLTWPIISGGKSKRPTFMAKAIANYGRDCALPGFARALAGCAG